MNRIAIVVDARGEIDRIVSDEPVRVFMICDSAPDDRVYEMSGDETVEIGPDKMRAVLRDDPIGHANDSHFLGSGHGPRKPPSRPGLNLVKP